jgi:hypothetical protein
MRQTSSFLLFGVLALSIIMVSACAPYTTQSSTTTALPYPPLQVVSTDVPGYPPPPTRTPATVIAPTPAPTLIEVEPGWFSAPTFTPAPTITPRPTPTRRPGPTPTAVPLPAIPGSPVGIIRYQTLAQPPFEGPYTYYSIAINEQGQITAGPEPITLPLANEFSPFQINPSPDGRYLVMMRPVEPGGRPYIVNHVTGQTQVLFESQTGGSFFGWHPDGRHFLFWIDSVGLWLVDAETTETTTLALPVGPVQGGAIAPDGQMVAYIDYDLPDTVGALWFVGIAGSDAQPMLDAGDASYIYPGAWSPDGSQIVYYGNCSAPSEVTEATGPLCLLDTRTLERRALDVPFLGNPPRWSPDGRILLVDGAVEGWRPCDQERWEADPVGCAYDGRVIYLVDVASGQATPLTEGALPVWSPDGSLIAFYSARSGSPEVWLMQPDGTNLQQLTSDGLFKQSFFGELSWMKEAGQ